MKQLKTKIKSLFKNNIFVKEWKEIDKEYKTFYFSRREILIIVCCLIIAILFLSHMFFMYQNQINVLNPFGSTSQQTSEFFKILKIIDKVINIVVITICSFILIPTSLLMMKIIYKTFQFCLKTYGLT